MATPYLASIMIFAGNFTVLGWAQCNGQLLSIAQNSALFSLIGTNYGGNGTTNFALPNLQGRFPTHQGQGSGLSYRSIGEMSGVETVSLLSTQMPQHNHTASATTTLKGSSAAANASTPDSNVPGSTGRSNIYQNGVPDVSLDAAAAETSVSVDVAGGSQPHNNMPPYLVLNFQIALEGIFPSRT